MPFKRTISAAEGEKTADADHEMPSKGSAPEKIANYFDCFASPGELALFGNALGVILCLRNINVKRGLGAEHLARDPAWTEANLKLRAKGPQRDCEYQVVVDSAIHYYEYH